MFLFKKNEKDNYQSSHSNEMCCACLGQSALYSVEYKYRKVKVKNSRYRPTWPRGVQEFKAPRFHDTRHMKVVRSSPLRTSRLYTPGISWYSFLEAESTPVHMDLSDTSVKIPIDTTGDRSRDLPTSSAAVPQALNTERYGTNICDSFNLVVCF